MHHKAQKIRAQQTTEHWEKHEPRTMPTAAAPPAPRAFEGRTPPADLALPPDLTEGFPDGGAGSALGADRFLAARSASRDPPPNEG